ncbi:MAG: mannose-6-phosphate isomerase, class I [Candidatus Marinimicrobia bacterium]|nr:mannose-6-phosphate isomerase, class I [Candidatus Neomarinimicrobiota bacterium]MCF7851110.1 mannose-6-phosphate isomerase, class I [Candidatus Neomarinimicrobiota bacterium]MCF7904342.1 mannose-6-phosphate isomerase, class I [Candidatus Neomarinimicrobiota bacterium]
MGSSHQPRLYLLNNIVQNYAWGQRNESAFIARLLNLEPENETPYAELWMGTHPNGPSQLIDPQNGTQTLADWIAEDPINRLSLNRSEQFSEKLPYLFKVLSAEKMLSIQTHPDRQQAIKLHATDPLHYPDDNHKPEIAIAIDHLEALVGFISDQELQALLHKYSDLKDLLGLEIPGIQHSVLKLLDIWGDTPERVTICIEKIQELIQANPEPNKNEQIFLEQVSEHGTADIGILFILLLKYEYLEAGEALFLGPGIPHAYLRGNIIECMANSDNVVRLGLTPKFCDTEALKDVLNFNENPEIRVIPHSDGQVTEYITPTSEFLVKSLALDEADRFTFEKQAELTLFLVLQGEVNVFWSTENSSCCGIYQQGDSFVVPANLPEYTIKARQDSQLYFVKLP